MKRALFAAFVLLGCGARTELAQPDAATDAPTVDAPESLAMCFGEIGPSAPTTLRELRYIWEEFRSGDGKGVTGFDFHADCRLQLSAGRLAVVEPNECEALRRWATSARLLDALRPESPEARACVASAGDRYEETNVLATHRTALSTGFCAAEPFLTHRRCMRRLWVKYGAG